MSKEGKKQLCTRLKGTDVSKIYSGLTLVTRLNVVVSMSGPTCLSERARIRKPFSCGYSVVNAEVNRLKK